MIRGHPAKGSRLETTNMAHQGRHVAAHPVHVHGASFQVQTRTGGRGRVFDWERGWKDTVVVNDKETVEVLIQFVAYRGLYVIHCHQLGHEDGGMMANFEVV